MGHIFESFITQRGRLGFKFKGFLGFNLLGIWVIKNHYWETGLGEKVGQDGRNLTSKAMALEVFLFRWLGKRRSNPRPEKLGDKALLGEIVKSEVTPTNLGKVKVQPTED